MKLLIAPASRGSPYELPKRPARQSRNVLMVLMVLMVACWVLATPAAASELPRLAPWPQPAAPALSALGLDGAPHNLDAYAGRLVLVHFFATWCETCREEMTSLSALAERHTSGQRLAIIAVDFGEVPERVRRYFAKAPVNFPVLLDVSRDAAKAWGVEALPTTFILDKHLRPRFRVVGDLDWMRPDVLETLDALAIDAPSGSQAKQSKREEKPK